MKPQANAQPALEPGDPRDFVKNAPVGMHETDADHRILWANRAELDQLGYRAQDYVGRNMADFFLDPDDFRKLLRRLKDHKTATHYEARLRRGDNSPCVASLTCNVRWKGDQVAGIRFVVRDVTDVKRSESELRRRRAEIESLNQRLRRAMSETHHRVKNNLQIIAALVDMQLMANDGLVPANELKRVENHIHALAAIHDLLTVEARKDPALESISIRATLDVLRPLLQEMVGDRPVRFSVQDVHLPLRQETAVALVVNELIANAARYGCGPIELTLKVTDSTARLEVSDEGPGFPAGFDPTRYTNTGLELVEAVSHWDLQGRTSYGNRPGSGATVTVAFPLQPPVPYSR